MLSLLVQVFYYLALQLKPSAFFLCFLFLSFIFLHTLQEAISTLRMFNMLNTHINSLGEDLAPKI